jgi:hypothetical protein
LLANKCKHLVSAGTITSDPTQIYLGYLDNKTVAASKVSLPRLAQVCSAVPAPMDQVITAVTVARDHAIADTGATTIFIMDGIDVINKRVASKPLTINLPDSNKVQSSHVCDFEIPGLPTVLTGHIVPSLTVTSLIGICPLCKAGCKVIFDDLKCDVVYDGNVILRGHKDPSTDLWTLLTGKNDCTTPGPNILSQPGSCLGRAPHVGDSSKSAHPAITLSTFTHSVCT